MKIFGKQLMAASLGSVLLLAGCDSAEEIDLSRCEKPYPTRIDLLEDRKKLTNIKYAAMVRSHDLGRFREGTLLHFLALLTDEGIWYQLHLVGEREESVSWGGGDSANEAALKYFAYSDARNSPLRPVHEGVDGYQTAKACVYAGMFARDEIMAGYDSTWVRDREITRAKREAELAQKAAVEAAKLKEDVAKADAAAAKRRQAEDKAD